MTGWGQSVARRLAGWRETAADDQGCVVALGNFDGVHRGHQAVLARARAVADRLDAPMAAAVFSPHPRRFFQPDGEAFQLLSDAWRARALADAGATRVFEIPFDRDLSLLTASDFVRNVLVDGLGARGVVVGFDFQFGHQRSGAADTLVELGSSHGLAVEVAPRLDVDGAKCSSSAIRALIRQGDVDEAARWLTRPWLVDGVVQRGDQRGRTLGFPTANVPLGDLIRPRFGVYAVSLRVEGEGGWRAGVANVGRRPTFAGADERLEAHIFDFDGDLYDTQVDVALHAFIRPERAFDSLDALQRQIAVDSEQARVMAASRATLADKPHLFANRP